MPQLDFDISAALTTDAQSAFDAAIKALEAPLAGWREAPLPHFYPAGKNRRFTRLARHGG